MVTFRRLLSPLLLFSPPTAVAAFTFLSIFPSKSYTKKKIIRIGASTAGTTNASPSLLWVSLHNCKRIRQQSRYSSSSLNDRATDDDLEERYKKVRPDMKYIPRNVMRQHGNFEAIRNAAGSDLTNDVYVRAPQSATKIMAQTFWFVGKVARVSDVSVAQAVARQWPLIETHAANLRPRELFAHRGALEIWTAPGDSELDVAYNRPSVVFTQHMEHGVEGAEETKANTIGFKGEMYEGGEEGFRTQRLDDGSPANPEIQQPSGAGGDTKETNLARDLTDDEMERLQEMIEGKDLNELYKEQQEREGRSPPSN